MSKDTKSIKTEMELEKETPNKLRYKSTDGSSPVETQYLVKTGLPDPPPEIISIEINA